MSSTGQESISAVVVDGDPEGSHRRRDRRGHNKQPHPRRRHHHHQQQQQQQQPHRHQQRDQSNQTESNNRHHGDRGPYRSHHQYTRGSDRQGYSPVKQGLSPPIHQQRSRQHSSVYEDGSSYKQGYYGEDWHGSRTAAAHSRDRYSERYYHDRRHHYHNHDLHGMRQSRPREPGKDGHWRRSSRSPTTSSTHPNQNKRRYSYIDDNAPPPGPEPKRIRQLEHHINRPGTSKHRSQSRIRRSPSKRNGYPSIANSRSESLRRDEGNRHGSKGRKKPSHENKGSRNPEVPLLNTQGNEQSETQAHSPSLSQQHRNLPDTTSRLSLSHSPGHRSIPKSDAMADNNSAVSGGIGTPATPATPRNGSPATEGRQIYQRISMVGEGTYGRVYKARNKLTGELVALKQMRIDMEREGFPITAMREIRLLKQLQHPNITRVLDVVPEPGNAVCVVMEYMDYDLSGLVSHPQWNPGPAHTKSLMGQLLEGLEFMHTRGILHRDIKGSNLLVNRWGQVKYVDFGLARSFHHTRKQELTNRVITLWYRPPEVLLGTTLYGPEVDIWSLGCVLLELFTKKAAFQGQNDIDQLEQIFKVLGTPSSEMWNKFKALPWACYMTPNTHYKNCLQEMLGSRMSASTSDLISWMLMLDPSQRPTAGHCLAHRFFAEEPSPVPPTEFPVAGDWHEFESKAERRKRRQQASSRLQNKNQFL